MAKTKQKPISRQRRWQKKHAEAGLCALCSEPIFLRLLCKRHHGIDKERRKLHAERLRAIDRQPASGY